MTKIISIVGGLQPSTPTIGTATAGDTTASVAFTPSTYIGKGTITYTATSSPGSFTATGSSSPLTVTGLSNGTAYTFTVTGTTNYGVSSLASSASNSITPASQGSFESIASVKATGSTTEFDFTSIPSTYAHLQIRISSRNTGNDNKFKLTFNGDTTDTNYYNQAIYSGSGAMGGWAYNTPWIGYGPESSNSSSLFGGYTIDIIDYANVNNKKKVSRSIGGYGVVSGGYFWYQNHSWSGTAVVNRVTITSLGNQFGANTVCSLYGIKGS